MNKKIIEIDKKTLRNYVTIESPTYNPHVSTIINSSAKDAQATRAKVVGSTTELMQRFMNESENLDNDSWVKFYTENAPKGGIDAAVEKILLMIEKKKVAIETIDREVVESWVHDLINVKTYTGHMMEETLMNYVSKKEKAQYQKSSVDEERKGIDGWFTYENSKLSVQVKAADRIDHYNTINEYIKTDIAIWYKIKKGNSTKIEITIEKN